MIIVGDIVIVEVGVGMVVGDVYYFGKVGCVIVGVNKLGYGFVN